MELTNAKALIAKISSDPETAKIFQGLTSAEAFEAEAKKLGYTCTMAEFLEAKKTAAADGEEGTMSDDELAQTSGGLSIVGIDYAITGVETANN
jgi:predicted ribosomally synthesized peptide with nif11-like leader